MEIFNNLNLSKTINLNLSYTYVKAEIGSNSLGFTKGKDMPGVPQQSIIANANYKFLSAGNLNINHVWKESTLTWQILTTMGQATRLHFNQSFY